MTNRRQVLQAGALGLLPTLPKHAANSQTVNTLESSSYVDGVSDTEIVLGTSAAFSGPSQGLGIELYRGASAYFEHINTSGGIHGRQIKLKLYDDGYQPEPAVNNTVELIQNDQVFALFGYVGTPTVNRVLPLLKKYQDRNILLFFPFTGAQAQRELPYGDFAFNLRASYRQETAGLVNNLLSTGRERIAVFYQADAYGRSGWAGVRSALANHELTITGEATYKRGTPYTADMRPQVDILKKYEPDAVICTGAYAACAAFARDAIDHGLEVPIANLSFVGSEKMLALILGSQDNPERYTKWLLNSQVVPSYADLSISAVRQYLVFMEYYKPAVPESLSNDTYTPLDKSFVSLEGFLNAKLIAEILNRLGPAPRRENIERAVYSIDNFDIGIDEKISFSEYRRQGLQRVYYTVIERNEFVPVLEWSMAFQS